MRRAVCFALFAATTLAFADNPAASFASGPGTIAYLAAGIGLPFLRDGAEGHSRAWRVFDSLLVSGAITESLGHLTHVRRPDGSGDDSFPSEHATAAFSVATMESAFHPREAPLWYLGAGLIAESRVSLDKHRQIDVVAGAAIGFITARWELSKKRGLVLSPLIAGVGGPGLMVSGRF